MERALAGRVAAARHVTRAPVSHGRGPAAGPAWNRCRWQPARRGPAARVGAAEHAQGAAAAALAGQAAAGAAAAAGAPRARASDSARQDAALGAEGAAAERPVEQPRPLHAERVCVWPAVATLAQGWLSAAEAGPAVPAPRRLPWWRQGRRHELQKPRRPRCWGLHARRG